MGARGKGSNALPHPLHHIGVIDAKQTRRNGIALSDANPGPDTGRWLPLGLNIIRNSNTNMLGQASTGKADPGCHPRTRTDARAGSDHTHLRGR
eukprot:2643282-Alexandrium_andersonii.AAC.1